MMYPMTDAVKQLMIINVLFFVGTLFVGAPAMNLLGEHYFENPDFGFWQLFTNMFIHMGIMHLAFNMLSLYIFGPVLEQRWGASKFIFFYISCGLGASLAQQGIHYFAFHNSVDKLVEIGFDKTDILATLKKGMVDTRWAENLLPRDYNNLQGTYFSLAGGASGAIYGIMVAFAFLFPNVPMMLMFIPIPIKAKYLIAGTLSLDFYLGFTGQSLFGSVGGVGHFAHIGGALIGYFIMWYWKKNSFNDRRWN